MEIETFAAALPHGITLSCRAAGPQRPGVPRVLLLHGFPESAFAWDGVMARLAPRARCIAPHLRGFERSSSPREIEAYRARHLVADISALAAQLGAPVDLLVAHDWGGALAWNLAAQHPHLVRRLMIVNSPHPATFLRELRSNPAQQQASAYMNFLCRPDAEALLAERGYARLWRFLEGSVGAAWLTPERRACYEAVWSLGLTGGLNYYRASPLRPPLPGVAGLLGSVELPDEAVTVRVPTTVLWGLDDQALLPGLLDGLGRWVPDLELLRVAGASHWIVHERTDWVAQQVARVLGLAAPEVG